MQPASFWQRIGASVIDGLIIIPLFFYFFDLSYQSKSFAYALALPLAVGFQLLVVFCHARFGATPGKMLLKIKVVDVSGIPLSFQQALRRQSVDLGISVTSTILSLFAIYAATDEVFSSAAGAGMFSEQRLQLFKALESPAQKNLSILANVWFALEFVTLLLNKEKRAIHDFIGRTRVIKVEPKQD